MSKRNFTPIKQCAHCGRYFPVPSDNKEKKYCSTKCMGLSRVRPSRKCEFCGQMYHPTTNRSRFCCSSCSSRAQQRAKGRVAPPRVCVVCGGPIPPGQSRKRQTCSEACFRRLLAMKSAKPRASKEAFQPGSVLDKYGKRHMPHVVAAPFPLPADPQWCPMGWREMVGVAG